MKRTSILNGPGVARARSGPPAIALGEAEGLDAHARSVAIRLNPDDSASAAKAMRTVSSRSRSTKNSIGRSNPDVEHERAVAIYDLLEENTLCADGH